MSIDYSNFKFAKEPKKKHERLTVSEETYQKVFEACKGRCVICQSTLSLELHHICGRGKDLTDNPDNCVMLCQNCHQNVVHKNNKKYRVILQELRKRL